MDHLQKFISHLRVHLIAVLLVNNILVVGGWYVGSQVFHLSTVVILLGLVGISLLLTFFLAAASTNYIKQPMSLIWQAVLHISPNTGYSVQPDLRRAHLGRELVTALTAQVYQIASVSEKVEQLADAERGDLHSDFVANSIPLPLVVLSKDMNILFANSSFMKYIDRSGADITGENVYSVMDLAFTSESTFDKWLASAEADKVTDTQTWERVRLNVTSGDQHTTRLFDLVAYYNKNNPQGFEIILTMFDRTRQYSQDDQALSFVALAVHELRTPLTLLRGYIDVFEEELGPKLDDELTDFMRKMKAAAQQLAAFTSNVLNVARFENNQLVLKLREEQWAPLLRSAVSDMELRAKVRGISLSLEIEDKLPTVGLDPVSIYEVVCNLIDNAIKYSGDSKHIAVRSYRTKDGMVETVVQDTGVGIPETSMPNLFDKFYRDPHNRSQVGGTGMGLYLSKAIVTAHSGNVWVQSKEGKGSTFGFTLTPYSQLADKEKKGDNADIVRTAHGWIKNHSMYRR
ncbi:MAG TPA: PAS domain-containing sensor histidine kinase [Candidatus Saccharimonadales bacterium]|nr:PAS domain-containing sensor histidine kinase [Candidatus Saccharimonadales bacterium]